MLYCGTEELTISDFSDRAMAPYLEETLQSHNYVKGFKSDPSPSVSQYIPGRTVIETHQNYEYADLMPHFPDVKWDALEEVPYNDKGLLGDPEFRNLKSIATKIVDSNPKIGTEVSGVDLTSLTDVQKNDIARLIATRGVVFFRDQKNLTIEKQRELGQYFGTLHRHATTSTPKRTGLDDVHVVWADASFKDQRAMFTPSFMWHSDVSIPPYKQHLCLSIMLSLLHITENNINKAQVTYEIQPPSYTSLKLLTSPPIGGGGDTLWSSQYAAYDSLSAPMQTYLSSLTALHSAQMQADGSVALGRTVRRDPIVTEHPLIRTHPVTGWKSLFFNPGFVTKIVGIPKIESDAIISYLNEVISTTQEFHVRFQWQKNDVAFWDNRICVSLYTTRSH
jgi:sulfonate dioxygenase